MKEIVKTTIESLKKNNIKAYYFTDIDSAADAYWMRLSQMV